MNEPERCILSSPAAARGASEPMRPRMTDDEQAVRKRRIFKACMLGLMAGSGTFLALRYVGRLDVDPSLIVGAGIGVAVGMFLLRQVDRT